jgi:ribosomal protein S18 acetylase RimI-like enzyme
VSNVHIRLATPADAEALVQLITEHAKFEKEEYSPEGKLEKIRACLAADPPPYTCLVVETEDGVQGYCTYMSQFDSWYGESHMSVDALFLRESLRGASIGKALMERVKKEAKQLGYSSVRLMTPSDNTGAIKFYEKLGGEPASKLWFWFQL